MEHRGALETVLRHIPGFRGYLEKEYRRDSDALQRQFLTDKLAQAKRSLDTLGATLADSGKLALLTRYDHLRAKIDLVIARIRGGWQGYSGMFDLVKVDTTLLDQVYEHDVTALKTVEEFAATIARLVGAPAPAAPAPVATGQPIAAPATAPAAAAAPAPADPEAALPQLEGQLDALQQACDQRAELLKGLG